MVLSRRRLGRINQIRMNVVITSLGYISYIIRSMEDHELLTQYEPVLRFSKSERFFPMSVEPYLEKCHILPSGPQGVVGLLAHLNEPVKTSICRLKSGEYYLRFVNDPLSDSSAWVWWGILSVVAAGVGWFAAGWMGVRSCS